MIIVWRAALFEGCILLEYNGKAEMLCLLTDRFIEILFIIGYNVDV